MAPKQILIVVAIVVLVQGWRCHACLEEERIALLQLKASFINSSLPVAESLYSWGKTANCCIWDRIECDSVSGRVTLLDLSVFSVFECDRSTGSTPMLLNTSLFLPFKQLNFLQLSSNNIIGCVENEGFEKLAELRNLEFLYLSCNNFSNSILSSLNALSSLKLLYLFDNSMKGTINLAELSNLINLETLSLEANEIQNFTSSNGGEAQLRFSNLQRLYLWNNCFGNSILSSFKGLSFLKYLDLGYNQLKGSLNIKDLSDLRNLEVLDLSGNEISKFVTSKDISGPSNLSTIYLIDITTNGRSILLQSLGVLPYLRKLHLEYSDLRGARFGSELYNFTNLEELFLNESSLDENFLQSLSVLPSLKILSLSGLNGSLPTRGLSDIKNVENLNLNYNFIPNSSKFFQAIERMTSLKVLSLFGCGLTDILAKVGGLCNLKYLQELYMRDNDLGGNLPWCLANLTSLERLDLSSNHFMGNISSSPLSSLTVLQGLGLSGNQFRIPISLGPFFNLSKLKRLYVSGNELYATVEGHDLTPRFQLESITLSSCGSTGSFPSFLYHQHDLQYVGLSSNKLSGEFPYWLLDNNTKLERLYLANNSLSGVLQLPIHSHGHLTELDFSYNCFSGQIPKEIGAYFPRLEDLHMNNNGFNGTIPSSLGDLSSLYHLNMSNNGFNGTIPSSFGDLSSLIILDLSNNKLSGEIPEDLVTNGFSLRYLLISNNNLQGQIFPKRGHLQRLQLLKLDGNRFNGTIPHNLSNCSSLTILDVKSNQISGKIPGWLGDMPSLEVLDVSMNKISGSELSCSSASLLKEVHLSKNIMQGSLAYAFSNCSNLRVLDLSRNFLAGSIPKGIEKFSILSYLQLSHNNLKSEIPIQVCRLHHLRLIDLSNNHFSGNIPQCLGFGSNMMPGVYVNETVDGREVLYPREPLEFIWKSILYSYYGSILTLLYGIDLSCNNLTGQIPHEIGNLGNIRVLNLSYNHLSGSIPPTLSNLQQIESLDLSHNNLEGKIPSQLTQLTSISSFSVAYNNLSGKTPERVKQFATFENNSYKGNPFLCGEPLSKSCTPTVLPSPMQRNSSADDEDNGLIDIEVFYVSFLVTYFMVLLAITAILCINPQWRRAWFYFIEVKMADCYYFFVDNCPRLFRV